MLMHRYLAGIALLITTGAVSAQEITGNVGATSRPTLELKGIALGTDLDSVKAKLPDAECESMGDGTIVQCYESKSTLGGRPADILVRLLNGKVVYVAATRMTQGDAFDVADALKVKFGPPDSVSSTRITLVRPDRDQSVVYRCPVWKANGGAQELNVNPGQYTDTKRQFTYAAVVLTDIHLHDNVWWAKKENRASTNDL